MSYVVHPVSKTSHYRIEPSMFTCLNTLLPRPSPPRIVVHTNTNSSFRKVEQIIMWDPINGTASYRLERNCCCGFFSRFPLRISAEILNRSTCFSWFIRLLQEHVGTVPCVRPWLLLISILRLRHSAALNIPCYIILVMSASMWT